MYKFPNKFLPPIHDNHFILSSSINCTRPILTYAYCRTNAPQISISVIVPGIHRPTPTEIRVGLFPKINVFKTRYTEYLKPMWTIKGSLGSLRQSTLVN